MKNLSEARREYAEARDAIPLEARARLREASRALSLWWLLLVVGPTLVMSVGAFLPPPLAFWWLVVGSIGAVGGIVMGTILIQSDDGWSSTTKAERQQLKRERAAQ